MTLENVLELLKSSTDFVPEIEPDDGFSKSLNNSFETLIHTYPTLKNYTDYLDFLRKTGGAFIDHRDFSLGIYGLVGYVVTSFEEHRLFLDKERFFHFSDVIYPTEPDSVYTFAFDFQSEQEGVYITLDGVWEYSFCSPSFLQFLSDFANGEYPAI